VSLSSAQLLFIMFIHAVIKVFAFKIDAIILCIPNMPFTNLAVRFEVS
jgi:hypothetical protein